MIKRPAADRFWEKVDVTDNLEDCWIWQGSRSRQGYATFSIHHYLSIPGSRWAYEYVHGPIPDGLEVHHVCNNGRGGCVNPYHLRAVTHSENCRFKYPQCRRCGRKWDRVKLAPDGSFRQYICSHCGGNRGIPLDPGAARMTGGAGHD